MSLAVVLLNWRHAERTLRCARAVASWHALQPHLAVVDNESTEVTRGVLSAALPPESLICSAVNLGYAGGNNLGIEQSLAAGLTYVLLLNTDVEISAAGVSRLLDRLDRNPQIAVVGPVIQEGDGRETWRLVGGRDIARHSFTRTLAPAADVKDLPGHPLLEVDYVSGMVFLARATLFKEIGLLDEEYFFSGEIADLCKRAKNKGHKVCVDLEVEARHHAGQTPPSLRDTLYAYYSLRNRFLYVRKHHEQQKLRYLACWTMRGALGLARALVQGKIAKARAIFLAVIHAYRGSYGNQNAAF